MSRDVFHENVSPFHSISCPAKLVDPLSDLVLPKSYPNLSDSFASSSKHVPHVPSLALVEAFSSNPIYIPSLSVRRSSRISSLILIYRIFIVIC